MDSEYKHKYKCTTTRHTCETISSFLWGVHCEVWDFEDLCIILLYRRTHEKCIIWAGSTGEKYRRLATILCHHHRHSSWSWCYSKSACNPYINRKKNLCGEYGGCDVQSGGLVTTTTAITTASEQGTYWTCLIFHFTTRSSPWKNMEEREEERISLHSFFPSSKNQQDMQERKKRIFFPKKIK